MGESKLLVCCHQPAIIPEHPLLVPTQVGAALAEVHFPGFTGDDTGENISSKNRSYCELTAQYWAWKNLQAEHYGFFHYRRYLYPDLREKRPYRIAPAPTERLLDKLGFNVFAALIHQYDLILPKGEDMHIPVREHYAEAPFHHGRDLALAEGIVRQLYPSYASALETYLSGTICYFGNIFIMRRQIFQDYCAWLFPILTVFDQQADTSGYGPQEQRVDGYLAERLLGVYAEKLRRETAVAALELPRVHFHPGPDGLRRRLTNGILPPGSRRRAAAKRFFQSA